MALQDLDKMAASTARLGWYGDDFTGATDTLATAAQLGLRSMLFMGVPTAAQLRRAGALDAIGIAGAARSMAPDAMRAELEPVGRFFAQLRVPVLHYKVCSTFDSAPQVGSVGTAIGVLRQHVENRFVPIVGGQPSLGRYCVFGHLFARAGSAPTVHRIDRHPTMSRHPVTPMQEADLRLHLAAQGLAGMAGIDYPCYAQPVAQQEAALDAAQVTQAPAVLLDVARPEDLQAVGRLVWRRAQQARLLAVGPSSVVQALATQWPHAQALPAQGPHAQALPAQVKLARAEGPVFVLAGSLSPITAQQVCAAQSYDRVDVDVASLVHGGEEAVQALADGMCKALRAGRSVLAVTAGSPAGGATAHQVAQAGGRLLARLLAQVPLRRVGIAGGDTSSLAVKSLTAWGLSFHASIAPGVALCRLHSDVPSLDGMEIMLKGGQMGPQDLFERLVHGGG
ncbi:four-carbon acid sugar kinase family protein [Acidovorax sp. sic0104]|uniref:four-carbon acid sugar kinase family protein n=1 Tax=Acidovorax sp. sic0104 TaxID=2854784 RepID=UPI00210703C5|nr:four-carbon acid sugar kinase family protein [Acidovorax sp. sic0104]